LSTISILPTAVRRYVHDFDARARRLALVRAAGLSLAVFSIWFLACASLDRALRFTQPVRLTLLTSGAVVAVLLLARPLLRFISKQVDWVDAAGKIERREPGFGQRLVTITSRVLGSAEYRGSDDMLRELLRDVDRYASTRDPAALLPARQVLWPWVAVVFAGIASAALLRVETFGMPALAARFFAPLADILPASTTRLDVVTGNRDVVQSELLRIQADVARLYPGGFVSLFLTEDDGVHWSRSTMEPIGSGRYGFTLAAVDRDFRYYVTAGDARSRTFQIRVRRPPAVRQFAIRYEYPAYTGRDEMNVVNNDGLIEAPIGTRATLTITATEPLDSALVKLGGEEIVMNRVGDDAREQRAGFVVKSDARYTLDMISDRRVAGEGPTASMRVRAIPDGKPLLRLGQAGENLRLHPRDIVPISYQALDDYGIAKLYLVAQANAGKPVEIPLEVQGDPRRQERDHELDLSTLPLAIGDVLGVSLHATDRAGQRSASEPIQILVSPRSVDLATYHRLSELKTAAGHAATLNEQLVAASGALEEADREAASKSLAYLAALNRANRQLTGAAEKATLLRQALFRTVVNSRSAELSTAIAGWIDQAQVQSWLAEDLFRRADAPAGMGSESRGMLARSLDSTRALRDELRTVAAGERAAAVLADRENLAASQGKLEAAQSSAAARQALRQSLQRAREDVAAGAKELGLDPAAADLDAQLKARVDGAATLLRAKGPVDFTAAAKDWSLAMQRDRSQPAVLDERLFAGAQAEALRGDADLIRAHDLQLAARAAARMESIAQADPSGRATSAAAFNEFAASVAALQREHGVNRRRLQKQPVTPEESKLSRQSAGQARAILQRWADEPVEAAAVGPWPGIRARSRDVESLAMRASAEMASKNYAAAASLDAELARKLAAPQSPTTNATTLPSGPEHTQSQTRRALARTVERAQKLDQIGETQEQIERETDNVQSQQAPSLAGRQRNVADAIGEADGAPASQDAWADPKWRGRATAAVLAVQESLAAMPQKLAAAQEALGPWREAVARADQAKTNAAGMPDQQRQPAAKRAAAQAARDAADAAQRFDDARRPVSASAAKQLAQTLEPFAPETDAARHVIATRLLPALSRLEEASKAGDAAIAFARAADEARQAIDAAQKELSVAQETLTARDPLVAAKWFARAAADSLSQTPPDLRSARTRQRHTSDALSRAWDRAIHDAAAMRLASLPAMQSVYGEPERPTRPATTSPSTNSVDAGALAEWNRLRPHEPDDASSPNSVIRESEPAGFEEPLRLYFETLNKSK
jgi:colicin import membrane protein